MTNKQTSKSKRVSTQSRGWWGQGRKSVCKSHPAFHLCKNLSLVNTASKISDSGLQVWVEAHFHFPFTGNLSGCTRSSPDRDPQPCLRTPSWDHCTSIIPIKDLSVLLLWISPGNLLCCLDSCVSRTYNFSIHYSSRSLTCEIRGKIIPFIVSASI